MAQVMVNFRIDEDVKKEMEQVCREMGMSMSTAFNIFAKKVGKEKRIPFEVTADPQRPDYRRPRRPKEAGTGQGEDDLIFMEREMRLTRLCVDIRQSLSSIHTAIPAAITGLPMERVRLLCGDELKEKVTGISNACGSLFTYRNTETLKKKDIGVLDEYVEGLTAVSKDLSEIAGRLIPAMKAWQGDGSCDFTPYVERLAAVSQKLDRLPAVLQQFLCSTACNGEARSVTARLRRAAQAVKTPYVRSALEGLEGQLLRHYDGLDSRTKSRLADDYLHTLELTLLELGEAEQEERDVSGEAALCLRAVNVLSQVIAGKRQTQQELRAWGLEAEVEALERFAAMRGDVSGDMTQEKFE